MFKNGFLEKSKKVLFGSGALTKYLPTYFKNQKYSPSFILKHGILPIIWHHGRNHNGVIARCGIVSHHPREEKPRESFRWYSLTNSLGMKPRLCENISLSSGNLLAHLILILFEYNFKWLVGGNAPIEFGQRSHGVREQRPREWFLWNARKDFPPVDHGKWSCINAIVIAA